MKKIFPILLAMIILASLFSIPAFADTTINAPGNATTNVELTVAAATFDVTVPTSLPISVAADGTVTCASASTAVIQNNCNGPIKVTAVAFEGKNGWTVVDYNEDMKAVVVGTKNIGLKINGTKAVSELAAMPATFVSSGCDNIAAGETAPILYDANIPPQSAAIAATNVAQVIFTVAWDSVDAG